MIQRNTNYSIKIKHDYLINHTNMGYLGALPRGNSFRDDSLHYTHDSLQYYYILEEQRKIRIKKPLPIYVRYYTAYADSNGLKLYIDIYKKDEEMMKLIYDRKINSIAQ